MEHGAGSPAESLTASPGRSTPGFVQIGTASKAPTDAADATDAPSDAPSDATSKATSDATRGFKDSVACIQSGQMNLPLKNESQEPKESRSQSSQSNDSDQTRKRRPRQPPTPEEKLSRTLAKTLRHAARSQGIAQDNHGWCAVADLIAHPVFARQGASLQRLETVVANDTKGRYEFEDSTHERIRAVQGHSAPVDVEMVELTVATLPPQLVHGTTREAWKAILDSGGLSRMSRLHIHMASGLPGDLGVRSGMRAGAPIRIWIDGQHTLDSGIRLFRAANGAILSPGDPNGLIPLSCLSRATDAAGTTVWVNPGLT